MLELLVTLLVFIVVLGLVYWVAQQFLPHPFPVLVLVVGIVVLLIALAGGGADLDVGRR